MPKFTLLTFILPKHGLIMLALALCLAGCKTSEPQQVKLTDASYSPSADALLVTRPTLPNM